MDNGADKRILVIEDHPAYAFGVQAAVAGHGLSVSHIEADAGAALEWLEDNRAEVDLVLADLHLADTDRDAVWFLEQVDGRCGYPPVLVCSGEASLGVIFSVLQAGACGFIDKSAADIDLYRTLLHRAARGEEVFDPNSATKAIKALRTRARRDTVDSELSDTHRRIVELVADGLSSAEIAEKLSYSTSTIDTYLKQAIARFGVRNRAALAVYCLREGLIR